MFVGSSLSSLWLKLPDAALREVELGPSLSSSEKQHVTVYSVYYSKHCRDPAFRVVTQPDLPFFTVQDLEHSTRALK